MSLPTHEDNLVLELILIITFKQQLQKQRGTVRMTTFFVLTFTTTLNHLVNSVLLICRYSIGNILLQLRGHFPLTNISIRLLYFL